MDENKQVEELIDINEGLGNYFNNTIIPQLFVDANFILRKFTPPAMKQFNFVASDIGKSFHEKVENIRFPSIIANIEQVMETHEILEKEIQTTDYRWYQMNIIPYVIQKTKKVNGVIITFIDITSRIKDLKEQEQLIADHEILLDTISHDIKNSLSSLILAIELFKTISLTNVEELRTVLSSVEAAVLKMKNIITELTDTRRQEHKYKTQEELLNFEHVLEDVRLSLSDDIDKYNVKIRSEINISEITYSRRKLRTILYNLINNAIKYRSADKRPEIFIKTIKEDDFILISIKDNGIGIEDNHLDNVFNKYYRANDSVEGWGVGLFLVKEIVTNTGGKILLSSKPGEGSEFQVYLRSS
jgi:two-component system, OmpR family, phosphate regulon sensor histidine kinase PhoR